MTVDLIPLDILVGDPDRAYVRLAPRGDRIAFLAAEDGVRNVWVQTVGEDDAHAVTHDRGRGIQAHFWAEDDRHLVYVQDKGGDENWRLYSLDVKTGEVVDLTPFDEVQAQVLSVEPAYPDAIVIALNKDNPQLHDPYLVNLATGELTKLADNPGFAQWVVDHDQKPRCGVAMMPDGGIQVMVDRGDGWVLLFEAGMEDALSTGPGIFSADGTTIIGESSVGANTAQLVRWDVATGAVSVLYSDPEYDVSEVITDPITHEVLAVGVTRDHLTMEVIDPTVAPDLDALARVATGDLGILSMSRDTRRWLVTFNPTDGPMSYYLWDRDTQAATFLWVSRQALVDYTLARMEPIEYQARDGLTIHGYVTFPPEVPRADLPTVMLVHGGPWGRDVATFHPEVQLLANRGYLVVQVNFRGSLGYGKAFVNAGNKEWGAAMHTDVLDGVAYVIDQGWADPGRIGVDGGSYGGYEALYCAVHNPDVFACAIDLCGPSNLITLIATIPPYWQPMVEMFKGRVGDPDTEHDFLWDRSPLSRAADLKVPLLIGQGANDPRVKQAEAEQIVAALRDGGIPHEYLLYPDEGHGLVAPEARIDFFRHSERFLATHLGGRTGPPA